MSLNVDIDAVFRFVAENPVTILIAGGILMYLVGSVYDFLGKPDAASPLITNAPWVIFAGIILQFVWMFRTEIGDSIRGNRYGI